jgi:cyclo(L-tyrosyl-L-tyrosyl) synthase
MQHHSPPDAAREFTAEPYTANCRAILARADHALLGVSPGNGYFSEERLSRLLRWANRVFDRVDTIVPDTALVHTFTALGASPEQAAKQAGRATRRTVRRLDRAWKASGAPVERHRVRILSEFAGHPRYRQLMDRCEEAVARDAAVRDVFRRAAGAALATLMKSDGTPRAPRPTDRQIDTAMRYLMEEIPLATDTPGLLGVPSSVHVYHRVLPITALGFGSLFASPRQAFAVVRERGAGPAADAGGGPVRP